jgi:hypothetical integral membrane protein (TIGR02206 family)
MFDPASFHPFGRDHLLILGLIVVLSALVALAGRRWKPPQIRWLGRLLALVLLAYVATVYLQKGLVRELSWRYALPLELCHWVMLACVVALFRPSPLAAEITYFVGLAGTLQATLTPEIGEGFPSWEFILFFWSHGIVLLAIVFLIASRQFKPRQGSVLRMMAFVNVYALAVGGIDKRCGWNYGYLCSKPGQPSLLDYLGPWPWYLVSLEFVALGNFLLLDLPWQFLRRREIQGQAL